MNSGVATLNRPVVSQHEVPLEDKLQLCATLALVSSRRCTVRVCAFSDVPPTCTEPVRMRMLPIARFWSPLGATPSMCKLQCCGFCSLLVWYNEVQRHFLLCCRLEMGMPRRGPRHCVGISLGSTGRRDAANSRTRMMATAVTGCIRPR